jgi:hypothetical protein
MAKKRYSDGGVLSTEGSKKAGSDAGKATKTTSFGKFLDRKIGEADKLTARMDHLDKYGPEALANSDAFERKLEKTGKAEREKYMDSMGSYKKGGAVGGRGDGKAVRGRTKGKLV